MWRYYSALNIAVKGSVTIRLIEACFENIYVMPDCHHNFDVECDIAYRLQHSHVVDICSYASN